jgi:hypothetical protein
MVTWDPEIVVPSGAIRSLPMRSSTAPLARTPPSLITVTPSSEEPEGSRMMSASSRPAT